MFCAVACSLSLVGDIYTRKIETEKRKLEDLDKSIKRLQNSILLQRKEMGGIHATRDSNINIQKQIRILENRLDKALVKFNEALAHNKSLRDQIDNLRRERVVFDGIYNKLARELAKKQSDMGDIMAETNTLASQRDQAQQEMLALKAQADQAQTLFENEWRNLGMRIEKDRKAKEMSNKNNGGGGGTRLLTLGGGARGGDPTIEAESNLRKRVTKGAWSIATDKANIHLSMEKVQAYEEAFAKIQKATRITDIDALVHTFVAAEDQNFSLFNYVNDLANEIEKVEEQNNQVKMALAKLKAADGANGGDNAAMAAGAAAAVVPGAAPSTTAETHDAARKKLLAELDAKLHKNNARARASEERFAAGSKTLAALKAGVGAIFAKLGCASRESSELLGNAGVTESNIMQYLGLIEARTNDLLSAYNRHRDEAGEGGYGYDEQGFGYAASNRQMQQQSQQQQQSIVAPSVSGGGGQGGDDDAGSDGGDDDDGSATQRRAADFDAAGLEDEDGDLADDGQPINIAQQRRRQQQQQQQGQQEEY